MLISICTPVMNRTRDLKHVMPFRIEAARLSPPVELVIVDYNSQDDLTDYMQSVDYTPLIYRKYSGRDTFHMAHAFNLAAMASTGEYIVMLGADAMISRDFIQYMREKIDEGWPWLVNRVHRVMICVKKSEFIAAGGYDERFELYGPEEVELATRLMRRGLQFASIPDRMVQLLYTPNDEKVKNYRIKGTKSSFSRRMRQFYQDNMENRVLVANRGRDWGSWGEWVDTEGTLADDKDIGL